MGGLWYSSIDDYLNNIPASGTYSIAEKNASGYLTEKGDYH